jgi:hypothetical protein
MLLAPVKPLDPLFSIRRIFCHRAHVCDFAAGDVTSVSIHDAIRGTSATLGSLVSRRQIGPFTVRLVRGNRDASDWWIVEVDSRGEGVVLLNYEGDAAHEVSARYAAKATEVDLTSDFNLHRRSEYVTGRKPFMARLRSAERALGYYGARWRHDL